MPATLPWPKIAHTPANSGSTRPSHSVCCAARWRTSACAMVRRRVMARPTSPRLRGEADSRPRRERVRGYALSGQTVIPHPVAAVAATRPLPPGEVVAHLSSSAPRPVPRLAQPSEPRRHLGDSLVIRHRSGKPFLRRRGEDRAADGEALHHRVLRREGEGRDELFLRRLEAEEHDAAAVRIAGPDRVLDCTPAGGTRLRLELPPIGLEAYGIEPLQHVGGGRFRHHAVL